MRMNEFEKDSLRVRVLGKRGIFLCLLLVKATLENFRIRLNKCVSFLYLLYYL